MIGHYHKFIQCNVRKMSGDFQPISRATRPHSFNRI
jgi:hypothetical protein